MLIEQQALSYQQTILKRIKAPDWTWEEACEMGLAARSLRDLSSWTIGQIALHIEIKWGLNQLGHFARILGFHKQTVEQYRWVVKKFGNDYQPTNGLPWSFFRLAAGAENPQQVIEKIVTENLTIHEAKKYVKGTPLPAECPHAQTQEVHYFRCIDCGKSFQEKPEPVLKEIPVSLPETNSQETQNA